MLRAEPCCWHYACCGREHDVSLLIITDPGPDPDDVKALLIAAVGHRQGGGVHIAGVVANGGGEPLRRARLARCILDTIGAPDIPVAVGSPGVPTLAKPHEYAIDGYAEVDDSRLWDGAELIRSVLTGARRQSLTVLCISGLTDFADIISSEPALVRAKVKQVSIQGGLERDAASPSGYCADKSVNNTFDMDAANRVYAFCFAQGIPMTVTSRFAVPNIPMQLAKSFALRSECPVMHYLVRLTNTSAVRPQASRRMLGSLTAQHAMSPSMLVHVRSTLSCRPMRSISVSPACGRSSAQASCQLDAPSAGSLRHFAA